MTASTCRACGASLLAVDAQCGYCGSAVAGALARERDRDALGRVASAALATAADNSLARGAPLDALIRQADFESSLSPAELGSGLSKGAIDAVAELERVLPGALASVEMGELRLARLVDAKTDAETIRVGMLFLRKGRFAEASEWWSLQYARFEQTNPRFALLLLVLDLVARTMGGLRQGTAELRARVQAHPLFASLAGAGRDKAR